jgi:hypothetical protein
MVHIPKWEFRDVTVILLYQDPQPSGGFGQARRLSAQEYKSMSWLMNGILLALQEIKNVGLSWKWGQRQKEFGSESRITKKKSFNSSCPNNPLQEFSRGQSFTFRPKMAASGLEDSARRSFKNWGLEAESRVRLANFQLALWGFDYGFTSRFMDGGSKVLLEVWKASLDLFSGSCRWRLEIRFWTEWSVSSSSKFWPFLK